MKTEFTKALTIGKDPQPILRNEKGTIVARFNNADFETDEECDKHVSLFAAAPELLLALEMAVMVMPNGYTKDQCKMIIKKATE